MPPSRPLTAKEEKLVARLNALQGRHREYLLRKAVLEARVALADTIVASFTEPFDDEALEAIGLLRQRQGDAYMRLSGWDQITLFFAALRDATYAELHASLQA